MGDGGGGCNMGETGHLNKRSSPPENVTGNVPPAGQGQKDTNSSLDLGQIPSLNIKDCAPLHTTITSTTCCSLPLLSSQGSSWQL